jgi:hypothetical protein
VPGWIAEVTYQQKDSDLAYKYRGGWKKTILVLARLGLYCFLIQVAYFASQELELDNLLRIPTMPVPPGNKSDLVIRSTNFPN